MAARPNPAAASSQWNSPPESETRSRTITGRAGVRAARGDCSTPQYWWQAAGACEADATLGGGAAMLYLPAPAAGASIAAAKRTMAAWRIIRLSFRSGRDARNSRPPRLTSG